MAQTYTVQGGDSLYKIARQFGVTVDAIVQANNIAIPSLIKPGQVLAIPDASSTPAQPPAPPPPGPPPTPLTPPSPPTPQINVADLVKGPPFPRFALKDPCAHDPGNLLTNGFMPFPGHDTPYGRVIDGWEPFIISGSPQFNSVNNEGIDEHPGESQQIFSSDTFDAGVYQVVRNLQPGTFYMIRWGYSLAAKSYDGPNVRVQTIGRKLGVDPYGGTNPKSPTVVWGPDYFEGQAAVNIPAMQMVFPAMSNKVTVFLRAMATDGSGGENRVWIDAICMEARAEIPPIQVAPLPDLPPQPPAPPTPPSGSGSTYTVQSGDTLSKIAKQYGVTVHAIVKASNIANPSLIRPGQVLQIPKS